MSASIVRETSLRAARSFAGERLPFTIECDSDEFFRRWFARESTTDVFGRPVTLGGELGFCYIDGNHSYEYARREFEHTDRALVPGGYVLFDDSADGSAWEVHSSCARSPPGAGSSWSREIPTTSSESAETAGNGGR